MKILDGIIIPGDSISGIKLGQSIEAILKIINNDYVRLSENGIGGTNIEVENGAFYFQNNILDQIAVFGDFNGKLYKNIGIGCTPKEFMSYGYRYKEINDYDIVEMLYELEGISGLAFTLGETEDDYTWDEMSAPIEAIFVYSDGDGAI